MLHENHFYMVDVALALAQLIGQEDDNGLAAVSDERLALKLEMSQKTLKVLDKLPGNAK